LVQKPKQKKEPQKPSVMWEYKVNDQVYGPYSNGDMMSWKQEGYFTENPVVVRKVDTEDIYAEEGEFIPCDQVDFSQYQ